MPVHGPSIHPLTQGGFAYFQVYGFVTGNTGDLRAQVLGTPGRDSCRILDRRYQVSACTFSGPDLNGVFRFVFRCVFRFVLPVLPRLSAKTKNETKPETQQNSV